MAERKEYHLTAEQHERLLDACKPTPAMFGAGGVPLFSSPQQDANRAWQALGDELGFNWLTVKPVRGKGSEIFTAEVKG